MVKTTADLRELLLDQLEQIRSNKVDPKKAHEITLACREIIKLSRLDFDVMKFNKKRFEVGEDNGNSIKSIDLVEEKNVAALPS